MEQRRLRLGDILDDYCPRERRVTNHAVVAMVEETVKQTRCSTCDAEHPYKGGQAPRRKKKETAGALYKEVLAGKPDTDAPGAPAEAAGSDEPIEAVEAIQPGSDDDQPHLVPASAAAVVDHRVDASGAPDDDEAPLDGGDAVDGDADGNVESITRDVEEGPVHRQLIRATLPRPEGQKDARTPPDFTIRQSHGPQGRGGNQPGNAHFRGGGGGEQQPSARPARRRRQPARLPAAATATAHRSAPAGTRTPGRTAGRRASAGTASRGRVAARARAATSAASSSLARVAGGASARGSLRLPLCA